MAVSRFIAFFDQVSQKRLDDINLRNRKWYQGLITPTSYDRFDPDSNFIRNPFFDISVMRLVIIVLQGHDENYLSSQFPYRW